MTLAEMLHHTSRGQKFARVGEEVAHDAPRGPKTPPPGVRPLAEPRPQRSDRTVRRSSGDSLPILALPSLAGSAGEAVDSSTLRFLTASALEAKRKLEEEEKKAKVEKLKEDTEAAEHEEKMLELNRRFQADLPLSAAERAALRRWIRTDPGSLPSSAGTRRKRKKRRKRGLPRTSSCPSRGRARCRQRQWHTLYAGFPGDVLLRAVLPSELLGVLAVMNQKDSTTLVVIHGSGICLVCSTGHDAPRVIFPSGVAKPRMLCILAGMDQKDCFDVVLMVQTADTVEFPQLQFMMVVDILFVPQTQFLMVQTVQQTTEFPQLQDFPGGRCSALLGSTVDTCLRQSTSSCFLLVAMHLAL